MRPELVDPDPNVIVMTDQGLQAAHAPHGHARSPAVLDHRQGGVAIGVELLEPEEFALENDATGQ